MTSGRLLTALFGCGILALACMPARGGSFSTSASMVSSTGCGGNPSQTGGTSANATLATPPLPIACTGNTSVWGGANVTSLGTLATTAEVNGNDSPLTLTATATLNDSLTFACAGPCPGGTLTGNLDATMTGAVFSQLNEGGVEYDSYTATITDTVTLVSVTGTGELCTAGDTSPSCTAFETNPSTGYSVNTSFTVVPGDLYTIQIVLTSYAANSTMSFENLATQDDPMTLTLPTGVTYQSASGQFLAPEPSSWLLAGSGLALCCVLARRRLARVCR